MSVPIQYDSDSGHLCFSSFSRLDVILCCLGLQLGKLERSDWGPSARSPPSIWHSWIPHGNGNSPVRTFRCPSGRRGLSVLSLLPDCLPVHGSWIETKARFRFWHYPSPRPSGFLNFIMLLTHTFSHSFYRWQQFVLDNWFEISSQSVVRSSICTIRW